MILQSMQVGPLGVNCYIAGDERSNEVIVIDPGGNPREIVQHLNQQRLVVRGLVLTHSHFDHVMGVTGVKRATGAPLWVGEKEGPLLENAQEQARQFGLTLPPLPEPERWLVEGDVLEVGQEQFQVIETPGHTPGGICLYNSAGNAVFVGDTLMRGTIGRTDFPGGSLEALLTSIRSKLFALPDGTRVYPGHGPTTTIAEEKLLNPFLKNYV